MREVTQTGEDSMFDLRTLLIMYIWEAIDLPNRTSTIIDSLWFVLGLAEIHYY